MQQATGPSENLAASNGKSLPLTGESTRFVINLTASTTPVGLVQPTHAGLKRFTFFVSRRREDGRERFRLHMGYFDSQEEAENLLDLVRDVYPAAWAGVAPGQRLRSRSLHPSSPITPAPTPAPTPTMVAAPSAAVVLVAPVAPAAPAATASVVPMPLVAPAAAAPPAAPPAVVRPAAVSPVKSSPAPVDSAAARSLTDIRAAIDSLRDRPAAATATATAPVPVPVVVPTVSAPLRGAQVLRLLEGSGRLASPARRAETITQPEPAVFAVQLLWSVQPIDMSQVPQLAIFSAYTLYGAEGNRDGRRWYGLRLGFFTDAVSAKQVAQYVRSEFTSVSVVPVTVRERERAAAAATRPLPATTTSKGTGHDLSFIEDVPTDTATSGSRPALEAAAATKASPPGLTAPGLSSIAAGARGAPGKRARLRVAQGTKPVAKRPRHDGPLSLEETLEILGASTLALDQGRGELINDSASRDRSAHSARKPRASRFGRLMDRLAERISGS